MADVITGDAPGLDPEPSYELPAGIPRDGSDELPAEPLETNDDAQPPAAAPPAAAPAAAAPPPAAPPAADPNADTALLNHPLVRRVLEDNQRLMRAIHDARQPQPPEPEAPPERDPADIQLEERMLQRIPWLAAVRDLFTNAQQLQQMQSLIAAAPQFQATVATHGDQVAEAALDRVITMYAERRGVEKTAVDLPTQQFLVKNLLQDIEGDQRLAARFLGGDLRVVDEVLGRQLAYFGLSAPAAAPPTGALPVTQPAAVAAIAQRVAGAQNLPRPGAGAVPPPASPAAAHVDPNDEDAVHAAGWAAVRAARR